MVQPIELNSNRVFVLAKADIAETVCHSEPKIVSDNSAPLLARQLALHANVRFDFFLNLDLNLNNLNFFFPSLLHLLLSL